MFLKGALKQLFLPPGLLMVGIVVGLLIWVVAKWKGRAIFIASAVLLILISLPVVSTLLVYYVQGETRVLGQVTDEQAIVILSAGVTTDAGEYDGATLDTHSLERVRYGAHLHRISKLPILVTGGGSDYMATLGFDDSSFAEMMARSLEEEFNVPVQWRETGAANTWENATLSAEILKKEGVERILLVTHGWHMPRAVQVFEKVGFLVTAAPTGLIAPHRSHVGHFIPSGDALRLSFYAFHEFVGGLYYKFRF